MLKQLLLLPLRKAETITHKVFYLPLPHYLIFWNAKILPFQFGLYFERGEEVRQNSQLVRDIFHDDLVLLLPIGLELCVKLVEGIDEGEVDVLVEEVEDKIFLVDVGEIDEGGIVDGFYDLEFFYNLFLFL